MRYPFLRKIIPKINIAMLRMSIVRDQYLLPLMTLLTLKINRLPYHFTPPSPLRTRLRPTPESAWALTSTIISRLARSFPAARRHEPRLALGNRGQSFAVTDNPDRQIRGLGGRVPQVNRRFP